ncbi:EpsG family protein [Vibrio breoganii]
MIVLINLYFLVISITIFFIYKNSKEIAVKFISISFFLLIIFVVYSMRGLDTGIDYASYSEIYNNALHNGELNNYLQRNEIGYRWLNYIGAITLGLDSIYFFGLLGVISWFFICLRLPRVNVYFLILLITGGFVYSSFNTIRQTIAISISIFIFSIFYLIDKEKLKYYSITIISILFHKSAVILLLFPLLAKINFNRSLAIGLYVLSLPFLFFPVSGEIFRDVSTLVLNYVTFVDYNYILTHGSFDSNSDRVSSGYGVLFHVLFNFYLLFFSTKVIAKNDEYKLLFLVFTIGIIFQNLFFASESVNRLLMYSLFLKPLILSFVVDVSDTKLAKALLAFFMSGYVFLFLYFPPIISIQ